MQIYPQRSTIHLSDCVVAYILSFIELDPWSLGQLATFSKTLHCIYSPLLHDLKIALISKYCFAPGNPFWRGFTRQFYPLSAASVQESDFLLTLNNHFIKCFSNEAGDLQRDAAMMELLYIKHQSVFSIFSDQVLSLINLPLFLDNAILNMLNRRLFDPLVHNWIIRIYGEGIEAPGRIYRSFELFKKESPRLVDNSMFSKNFLEFCKSIELIILHVFDNETIKASLLQRASVMKAFHVIACLLYYFVYPSASIIYFLMPNPKDTTEAALIFVFLSLSLPCSMFDLIWKALCLYDKLMFGIMQR